MINSVHFISISLIVNLSQICIRFDDSLSKQYNDSVFFHFSSHRISLFRFLFSAALRSKNCSIRNWFQNLLLSRKQKCKTRFYDCKEIWEMSIMSFAKKMSFTRKTTIFHFSTDTRRLTIDFNDRTWYVWLSTRHRITNRRVSHHRRARNASQFVFFLQFVFSIHIRFRNRMICESNIDLACLEIDHFEQRKWTKIVVLFRDIHSVINIRWLSCAQKNFFHRTVMWMRMFEMNRANVVNRQVWNHANRCNDYWSIRSETFRMID